MVLSKSDPRRISPLTGSRDSSFSRAATDRSRLILINETDSRSFVNPHQSKNALAKWRLPVELCDLAEFRAAQQRKPTLQLSNFAPESSYHKADVVKEWLAAAGRKIVLHLLPPYCPHLDPIERLWALMHENVTHNRDYKTFNEFRREILKFLRQTVPKQWKRFCDQITDNFRVIHRADFRVIA